MDMETSIRNREEAMAIFSTFPKLKGKPKIRHIVTEDFYEIPQYKNLVRQYTSEMHELCKILGIKYEVVVLETTPYTFHQEVELAITNANFSNKIWGILLDYPFIPRCYGENIRKNILPIKDISSPGGNMHYCSPYAMIANIIAPADRVNTTYIIGGRSHMGIIPNTGSSQFSYIWDYNPTAHCINPPARIISLQANIAKSNIKINDGDDMIVIDFGYCTDGSPSVQADNAWTWDNGLMTGLIWAQITNLLKRDL